MTPAQNAAPTREMLDAASALLREVSETRRMYVDRMVNDKINRCNGECSNAEVTEWENDAHRRWREKFPTLAGFLIPHGSVGT